VRFPKSHDFGYGPLATFILVAFCDNLEPTRGR
jgi:hypothetical protein